MKVDFRDKKLERKGEQKTAMGAGQEQVDLSERLRATLELPYSDDESMSNRQFGRQVFWKSSKNT